MTQKRLRHFSIMAIPCLRGPVSEARPDGTLCFADNSDAHGCTDRSAALFKDGKWTTYGGKDLRFVPNYWTVMDERARNGS